MQRGCVVRLLIQVFMVEGKEFLEQEKYGIEAETVSYSFVSRSEILGGETHRTGWFHVSWAS